MATARSAGTRRAFLEALHLKAAPAAIDILTAVETLKALNADQTRKVPLDAPTSFVRKRWEQLVFTAAGVDRRFYELCTLVELKNALRSRDIWVQGSRQFKDFDTYLVPADTCAALKQAGTLPLHVSTEADTFLTERLRVLNEQLRTVNRLARADELPDAIITDAGLKITPLTNAVPEHVDALMQQAYGLLPHVKITDLLQEVDAWTNFSRHFTHIKSGEPAKDQTLLLTAVLADGINLGLSKMAESCPGTTYAKLSWLQAWHIRDGTYAAALAEVVNAQFRQPFAGHWGDGTASSSDGQRFRTGGHAEAAATSTRSTAANRACSSTHGRIHRPRLRPDAPAGLPLRAPDPGPRGQAALRARQVRRPPRTRAAHRRHDQHEDHSHSLG
jgi:hypothetical protein